MSGTPSVLKGANRAQVVWEAFMQEVGFELKTEYKVAVRRVYTGNAVRGVL